MSPAMPLLALKSLQSLLHRATKSRSVSATCGLRQIHTNLFSNQLASLTRGGASNKRFSSTQSKLNLKHRVYLAVGSNLGDRFQNIATALDMLCDPNFDESTYFPSRLMRTSFLHNTDPMYVTDQPAFLNGAVELYTDLSPHKLLHRLKKVEKHLGRNFTQIRNGPRPVDLDILLYDHVTDDGATVSPLKVDSPDLTVPHRLMQEREFVLAPLSEVAGNDYFHPNLNRTVGDLLHDILIHGGDSGAVHVLPLPRGRMVSFNETIIMGILNVTPDSFSDGGKWTSSLDITVNHALKMEQEGARIIDIGGESTRPGAKEIPIEEQIRRTVPVIEGIRKVSDITISIDTRHAAVARAAVEAGADIVNDVSGGTFDPDMLGVVADLGVPIILMHMRGTPESMQKMTTYDDVVDNVVASLLETSRRAEKAGIPRWQQVLDPGIGFAKDIEGNLSLLKHLARMRNELGNLPILLGTSRKGFIGKLTGESNAAERDYGTMASCVAALCLGNGPVGCNILRVHNVKAAKHTALVMDAIKKAA